MNNIAMNDVIVGYLTIDYVVASCQCHADLHSVEVYTIAFLKRHPDTPHRGSIAVLKHIDILVVYHLSIFFLLFFFILTVFFDPKYLSTEYEQTLRLGLKIFSIVIISNQSLYLCSSIFQDFKLKKATTGIS